MTAWVPLLLRFIVKMTKAIFRYKGEKEKLYGNRPIPPPIVCDNCRKPMEGQENVSEVLKSRAQMDLDF